MGYIEWTSGLSLGFEEIDTQHRGLVQRINSLAEAMDRGHDRSAVEKLLVDLNAYVATHFALEEALFDRYKYAEADAHKKEHAAFGTAVAGFAKQFAEGGSGLSTELLVYLRTWLTNHISFSDRKYRSTFRQNGLR
ncbi:MAG TPA: bacteriohemerythrin [Rectinemataceae bacterium]|nr:bacteriohemerythrin [Rectinemataceae bacterium]